MGENINHNNVWSSDYIENFEDMVINHHRSLMTFQKVGAMLAECGRIYGMKVDSLYGDVIRLSGAIHRENIVEPTMSEHDMTEASIQSIRRVRRTRACTTVVTRQLIDGPLQTTEAPYRIHRYASVRCLLQNTLSASGYSWCLDRPGKLWIDRDSTTQIREATPNDVNVDLPIVDWLPSTGIIRPRLSGYAISNMPCEHFRYSETSTADVSMPDIDFQFDMDSEPMPLNAEDLTMPAVFNSFTEDDRIALRRCSAVQPNTVFTEDLRPLTGSPLEYSYRRLTDIQSLRTSSHWKLPSVVQPNDPEEKNKRRRRRKIARKDQPVVLKTELSESDEQNFLSVDDAFVKSIRHSDQRNWRPNKLTMPRRMDYSTTVKRMPLMTACRENDESDHSDESSVSVDDRVDENAETGSVMSISIGNAINLADVDVDMDMDAGMDMDVEMDAIPATPQALCTSNMTNNTIPVAPDDHALPTMPPAPLSFMQITPANVDVKGVTNRCMDIIRTLEADGEEITFARVCQQLRADYEVLSPALVFSSILELANKNNFHLEKIGDNDFLIKRG